MSGSAVRVGTQLWMRSATCCAAYLAFRVLSKSFPSCLAFDELTRSMSTPLLRNWVKSSVVNTTAAQQFTTVSKLPQPQVVGLLIQHGRHRKLKWITSFNVQLLIERRLANRSRERQAVDFLVVIVFFVFMPLRVQVKPIYVLSSVVVGPPGEV